MIQRKYILWANLYGASCIHVKCPLLTGTPILSLLWSKRAIKYDTIVHESIALGGSHTIHINEKENPPDWMKLLYTDDVAKFFWIWFYMACITL